MNRETNSSFERNMKLVSSFLAAATALTDDEFAAFTCREGTFYQYSVGENGSETAIASASNNFQGCHPSQEVPCVKEELPACSVSFVMGSSRIRVTTNGVPDHNAWSLENNAAIVGSEKKYRFAIVPTLLENGAYTVANEGTVGFALNGVDIYSGYSADSCCDFAIDKYDKIDFCTGYASPTFPSYGRYHYHFYPASVDGYSGCLVDTCDMNSASPIVGVALDGFPIYGPVQYYSESEGKVYIDPANCSDGCPLTRLDTTTLDVCNGIEVADGNADDGTTFR